MKLPLALALCLQALTAACGLGEVDYAKFQVSCARERCPQGYCCDGREVCQEGDSDDLGQCVEAPGGPR